MVIPYQQVEVRGEGVLHGEERGQGQVPARKRNVLSAVRRPARRPCCRKVPGLKTAPPGTGWGVQSD